MIFFSVFLLLFIFSRSTRRTNVGMCVVCPARIHILYYAQADSFRLHLFLALSFIEFTLCFICLELQFDILACSQRVILSVAVATDAAAAAVVAFVTVVVH